MPTGSGGIVAVTWHQNRHGQFQVIHDNGVEESQPGTRAHARELAESLGFTEEPREPTMSMSPARPKNRLHDRTRDRRHPVVSALARSDRAGLSQPRLAENRRDSGRRREIGGTGLDEAFRRSGWNVGVVAGSRGHERH